MSKNVENHRKAHDVNTGLDTVIKRMENLIGLINAEKFDFEDVDAWKMGAIMEKMFLDRWKTRSDELAQLRIDIGECIVAGEITSEGNINELIDQRQQKIIVEETSAIKAIDELDTYFKNRLVNQLRDQVEGVSRDVRVALRNELLKHRHNIEKENGKFSGWFSI